MLPNAKDYKRRFEGNIGLNTGGIGCISPVPFVDKALLETVKNQVIEPTIKGLQIDEMPFYGFIYFGLILTKEGPKVIEYNCRLGDPETQVILPRIHSDLVELFEMGFEDKLSQYQIEISENFATTVILASDGYPENYVKGFEIKGMEDVNESIIFHAGTKIENNLVFTNGGRVMAITSLANTMSEALEKCYQSINQIHYNGKVFRNDIGFEFL
jgi:phosphoribosylamine--glycine ligase